MPRRTSTPAPGARSPGCRRSHDPWRKVGGIRPRTPRRRLPQRSRLLPASKGPTRSIFGLSCPRPLSSPRQTAGATGCRAGWVSGARSRCWSARPSAAGSSVRRPSSPSACRRRCRCSACGCWAGCSRCAAPSPTRSSRRCFPARAACTCTSARGSADYLLRSLGRDPALPENARLVHYVAAAAITVTAALNYYGVRWSALVLNLTTGAKYGALLLLVLLAFLVGRGDWSHFTTAAGPLTPGLFGLALVSVLWAYDDWGDLSFVGGEVRDPERNLPRALVMGTASIIAIYLLVNAAYLYLIPIGQMGRSPLVAADAAQQIIGQAGVGLVAIVVMVATFSTLLGSILTSPRIFFAMADDGLLFKAVARVHPRFQTTSVAIVVTGVLGVVWVLFLNFEQLADQFVVAIFPFYALAAAAVFVLRRRRPDLHRPVRVLGYPVVPLLFVLATFLILGNALWAHPRETGFAFLIILLGIPVYSWWIRRRGSAMTQMGRSRGLTTSPGAAMFDPAQTLFPSA